MSLPVPTGTVTAVVNGVDGFQLTGTLDSNGNATLSGTVTGGPLSPGNHSGNVQYSGDSNYPANQWNYNFNVGGSTNITGTVTYDALSNTLTVAVSVTAAS